MDMDKENKIVIAIIIAALIMAASIYFSFKLTGKAVGGEKTSSDYNKPNNLIGRHIVTKIIDGDTVIAEGDSVRLLGIDADEKTYPCYEAAKKRIEELVLGKEVNLEKDVEDKDQYQRYLRYIFLDNKNINLQLVAEGLAVARFSPENVKYKSEIIEAEKQARENKIGCKWGGISQTSIKSDSYETGSEWKKLAGSAIGACNAGNYIGKEAIVEGKIVDAYKSNTNTVFINFEKPYPNSCFTAVIFSSDLYKFPENIEDYFEGKTARVKGVIKEYQGKPEVILDSLEQAEVL